jgi:Leucine Rich repeat
VAEVNLAGCVAVVDEMLWDLPEGLTLLDVTGCHQVTGRDLARQFPELARLVVDLTSDGQKLEQLLLAGGDRLDARSCQGIVDRDLMPLVCYRKLVTVKLRDCKQVTGAGLVYLGSSVRNLDLEGCVAIDDDALDGVNRELRELNVRGCTRVIGDRLDRQFPKLDRLNAERCWAFKTGALPPALTHLRISHNEIDDAGLDRLPPELAEFYLAKCHNVTEAALARRVGNMRIVSVRECRQIQSTSSPQSDRTGQAKVLADRIANNPWRLDVILNGAGGVANDDLQVLMQSRQLRAISLTNCAFDDRGLRLLGRLPRLEEVLLSACDGVTGEGFDAFADDSSLRTVKVSHCMGFSDAGLGELVRLENLKSFELDYSNTEQNPRVTDGQMARLATAPHLESVLLEGVGGLGNKSVAALLANMSLRRLVIGASPTITCEAFSKVRGSGLTHLEVKLCVNFLKKGFMSRSALGFLKEFGRLEHLALNGLLGLNTRDMQAIGDCSKLRVLSLANCSDLTDKRLKGLAGCVDLENLSLSECVEVTNAALSAIEINHPKLRRLDLRKCAKIDDQGLNHVGHLAQLQRLDVGYCANVTISGLGCLRACEGLTTLETKGINLSDDDRQLLARMLEAHDASARRDEERAAQLAAALAPDEESSVDGDDNSAAAAQYGKTPSVAAVASSQYGRDASVVVAEGASQYGRGASVVIPPRGTDAEERDATSDDAS